MAKNYFNRYIWLIDVINRHGHISREDISRLWSKSPVNELGESHFPERTFHNHIDSIYDTFGLEIKCDRSLGYYIANSDDLEGDGIKKWLMQSLSLNNLLNESADMRDCILFEDVPSSEKYLSAIIEAIRDRKELLITYHGFSREHPSTFEAAPYCLKQFRQRWYMVAKTPASDDPWIYALDRIQYLERTDNSYMIPNDFTPEEYFRYQYGVCIEDPDCAETVEIKVDRPQVNYFKTLPLHRSQQIKEETGDYAIFTYKLVPSYDLTQELLSKMDSIEILSPEWYRDEIRNKLTEMLHRYE